MIFMIQSMAGFATLSTRLIEKDNSISYAQDMLPDIPFNTLALYDEFDKTFSKKNVVWLQLLI